MKHRAPVRDFPVKLNRERFNLTGTSSGDGVLVEKLAAYAPRASACGRSDQRRDNVDVEPPILGVDFPALIADRAFDDNALRVPLNGSRQAARLGGIMALWDSFVLLDKKDNLDKIAQGLSCSPRCRVD